MIELANLSGMGVSWPSNQTFLDFMLVFFWQDSPPAWPQEVYRPHPHLFGLDGPLDLDLDGPRGPWPGPWTSGGPRWIIRHNSYAGGKKFDKMWESKISSWYLAVFIEVIHAHYHGHMSLISRISLPAEPVVLVLPSISPNPQSLSVVPIPSPLRFLARSTSSSCTKVKNKIN